MTLFFLLQWALALDCNHDTSTFRCVKVLKNYDGDTITVNIPNVHPLLGEKVSVRIKGIDTAEVKGKSPCEKEAARTAKNLVESMTKNAKRVDLIHIERDKYFRILADVIVDGNSIKDILLKNQLAVTYDGGTKQKMNWCDSLRKPASSKR